MTPWGRGYLYGCFFTATVLALANLGHGWMAIGVTIAGAIILTSEQVK